MYLRFFYKILDFICICQNFVVPLRAIYGATIDEDYQF